MATRITQAELSSLLAARADIPVAEAETFVARFFETLSSGLVHEKLVKVRGLGTFKVIDVNPRTSVNINTGERYEIASHAKVSFTPDSTLHDIINRPFAGFETVVLNENTDLAQMEAVPQAAEEEPEPLPQPIAEPEQQLKPELQPEPEQQPEPELVAAPLLQPIAEPVSKPIVQAENTEAEEKNETIAEATAPEVAETIEESIAAEEPVTTKTVEPKAEATIAEEPEHEEPETEEPEHGEPETEEPKAEEPNAEEEAPAAVAKTSVVQEATVVEHAEVVKEAVHVHNLKQNNRRHWLTNCLAAIVILALGYCIGYYMRPMPLPSFLSQEETALLLNYRQQQQDYAERSEQISRQQEAYEQQLQQQDNERTRMEQTRDEIMAEEGITVQGTATATDTTAARPASTAAATSRSSRRSEPSETLAYPQIEGGEYYIVGIRDTVIVKPGMTLLNLAIKYYKNKNLYIYICKLSNIEDPNRVHPNQILLIPELRKKED